MTWLIAGVALWIVAHSIKSVFPAFRQRISEQLGVEKSQGVFALVILTALAMIIIGWRSSEMVPILYVAPVWVFDVAKLLVGIGVYLFVTSVVSVRVRKWVRHPMLTGISCWALGHLLCNGELRSVILFGGFLFWALFLIPFINRRDGEYTPPVSGPAIAEIKAVVITLVMITLLLFGHGWYTGITLLSVL